MISRMMGDSSGSVKRRLDATGRSGVRASSTTERREALPRNSLSHRITQPQSVSAAICTISGLVKPSGSLMTEAPRRTHILATSAWRVLTQTIAPVGTRPRTTGTTRSASAWEDKPLSSGVVSPQTSSRSAPSSSICLPRATASSVVSASGPTSITPMMRGRASDSSWRPQRQTA